MYAAAEKKNTREMNVEKLSQSILHAAARNNPWPPCAKLIRPEESGILQRPPAGRQYICVFQSGRAQPVNVSAKLREKSGKSKIRSITSGANVNPNYKHLWMEPKFSCLVTGFQNELRYDRILVKQYWSSDRPWPWRTTNSNYPNARPGLGETNILAISFLGEPKSYAHPRRKVWPQLRPIRVILHYW